jgi:enoyl-CoA hydratase
VMLGDPASTATQGAVELALDGDTAVITVDRAPKLNALTPELLEALEAKVHVVERSDCRLMILRTGGERAFCVGADITRFAALSPVEMWRDWTRLGHRVFDSIARLPQPTISVIQGDAFGGGLELALATDFRVVADHARLGLPETGLGTIPGWGGTERLTELIGPARAKLVCLARRHMSAQQAFDWGAVSIVAPAADLERSVGGLCDDLRSGAPIALSLAKQLIDAAAAGAPARVLEPLASAVAATTNDLREGITAFHEKRSGRFKGA